jgi:putative ABC transport system ATP-binding protein
MYSYDRRNYLHFPDWSIRQGQHVLISGDPGSGKSTLIRLLSGELTVRFGELAVCDVDLKKMDDIALSRFRGRYIGIIRDKPYFIKEWNILDNLVLANYLGSGKEEAEGIMRLLHEAGLTEKSTYTFSELTIYEKQLVTLCRALVNKPRLILADDPTWYLDNKSCYNFVEKLINQAAFYESTLLLVTSDTRIKDLFKTHLKLVKA